MLVIVTLEGKLVKYLSATYEGKTHDKKICDKEYPTFPAGSILYQDTGFQGYAPVGVNICQPKKKPHKKTLSIEEREQSLQISRLRIIVEHVISNIKRLRIVKEVFRNWRSHFEHVVIELVCVRHNFRTTCRYKASSPPSGGIQ